MLAIVSVSRPKFAANSTPVRRSPSGERREREHGGHRFARIAGDPLREPSRYRSRNSSYPDTSPGQRHGLRDEVTHRRAARRLEGGERFVTGLAHADARLQPGGHRRGDGRGGVLTEVDLADVDERGERVGLRRRRARIARR